MRFYASFWDWLCSADLCCNPISCGAGCQPAGRLLIGPRRAKLVFHRMKGRPTSVACPANLASEKVDTPEAGLKVCPTIAAGCYAYRFRVPYVIALCAFNSNPLVPHGATPPPGFYSWLSLRRCPRKPSSCAFRTSTITASYSPTAVTSGRQDEMPPHQRRLPRELGLRESGH